MTEHISLTSATARGTLALLALCASILLSSDALALDAGDTLRVMTYNIQYAYCFGEKPQPETVAARIIEENPDVCGLQECSGQKGVDTPTKIAEATGMHLFFNHDEAILSKEEPLSTEVVDLLYYETYHRDLMIAEFDDYIIANTHMSRTSEYGLPEVDVITNALAKYEGKGKPILFMGDLNTRPGFFVDAKLTPLMQCISPRQMAVGEGTYCSETNSVGQYTWEWILDFIYMDNSSARSGEWSWTSHVVKDHTTSDHAPVVADITCKRIKRRETANGWIDEEAHTTGLTGTWSGSDEVVYDWQTFTAPLNGRYAFTPDAPSRGSRVTVDMKISFASVPEEGETPGDDVQGAVWIGTNGCFQVWTCLRQGSGGQAGWVDVEADGVTPQTGVEYTFRVVFDYRDGTYSASVLHNGIYVPLVKSDNSSCFPLATSAKALSAVEFLGDGIFTSLLGEYVTVEGFSENDKIVLLGNVTNILDAAEAAWLNSCKGGRDALVVSAAGLSKTDFDNAYLLNLDISGEHAYSFRITDVDASANKVTIGVTLTRTGAIAQSVNGVLKFYGAATLEAFKAATAQIGSAEISDDDFSEGDTATAEIPLSGQTPPAFFKAKIE